jgi:chaperonin GroES
MTKFHTSGCGTSIDMTYPQTFFIIHHKNNKTMSTQTLERPANVEVKVKPLADRVLVEPAPAEEKTIGGIIIPDTAKEKPMKGRVIAVGNGKKDEPMTLKKGDNVLYGKYAGTEITIDGREYLIMRESDVYAII